MPKDCEIKGCMNEIRSGVNILSGYKKKGLKNKSTGCHLFFGGFIDFVVFCFVLLHCLPSLTVRHVFYNSVSQTKLSRHNLLESVSSH